MFAWPGMGKLIIEAIYNLDRPIVVAYLMIIVLIFVTLDLIVDILYSVLDPRVRIKGGWIMSSSSQAPSNAIPKSGWLKFWSDYSESPLAVVALAIFL